MREHEDLCRALSDALEEATGIRNVMGKNFIAALAKRVTVKPEPPPKKVWSVSDDAVKHYIYLIGVSASISAALNAAAPDIIRERLDLVEEEWERRYRMAYILNMPKDDRHCSEVRRRLFPELDP